MPSAPLEVQPYRPSLADCPQCQAVRADLLTAQGHQNIHSYMRKPFPHQSTEKAQKVEPVAEPHSKSPALWAEVNRQALQGQCFRFVEYGGERFRTQPYLFNLKSAWSLSI